VKFRDLQLERLERDATFTGGYSPAIVRAFRKTMNSIRQAVISPDLYNTKSLHLEKLRGTKPPLHSMRLNDQFRLIVEFTKEKTREIVIIIEIGDYH